MRIKYIIYYFALLCCLLSSCTTSQKITINGIPGTEIYTPDMRKLGMVESNGKLKTKLPSEGYYAYLMSHQTGEKQLVPFALDYKNKSHAGSRILKNTGFGIAALGTGTLLVGTIAYAAASSDEDDDATSPFIPLIIGSAGAMAIGTAVGLPAGMRASQTQYQYNFKYLSSQTTIQDMSFRPIVDVGYSKSTISEGRNVTVQETGNDAKVTQTTRAKNRKSSTSSRTLKDYGKVLAGTYTGNGSLTRNDDVAEMYDRIHVIIKRISRNTVSIDVVESGEAFFTTGQEYTIRKVGNKFVLSLKGIPSAIINIDAQGKLTYYHPKINIDGEIYTLEISANRQ